MPTPLRQPCPAVKPSARRLLKGLRRAGMGGAGMGRTVRLGLLMALGAGAWVGTATAADSAVPAISATAATPAAPATPATPVTTATTATTSPAAATLGASDSASASAPSADIRYRVGRGDELSFKFIHTPELNTVAAVRSDGRVTLPLIGELPVAGLTLKELTEKIETGLSARVRRPEVAINVQGAITSQRVFIGGEVARPGVQPLVGPLTVVQAVMAAEGLKESAQPREVVVLRSDAQGARRAIKLDLAAVMAGADGAPDILLAPYDVVIVPRSGISNVGLWVDQYIRKVLPVNLGLSYSINRNGAVQ